MDLALMILDDHATIAADDVENALSQVFACSRAPSSTRNADQVVERWSWVDHTGETIECTVTTHANPDSVREWLLSGECPRQDLILVDNHWDDYGEDFGLVELLPLARERGQRVAMYSVKGLGQRADFVRRALTDGADAFLEKAEPTSLLNLLVRVVHEKRFAEETDRAAAKRAALDEETGDVFKEILGESPEILETLGLVKKLGPTDYPVLVAGETGSGKELIARALHDLSNRSQRPYVAINCAAIPDELIESELFGHVEGGFTGATSTRQGRFLAAKGGTLFLDEIGEMSLETQAKVLRAVEQKVVTPVGGDRETSVDIRILAATNRDLRDEVAQGRFREDLYYRIGDLEVTIPPLSKRGEDIALLARAFEHREAKKTGRKARDFAPDAVRALRGYRWPGNVRQLRAVIRKIGIFGGEGAISAFEVAKQLPSQGPGPNPGTGEDTQEEIKARFSGKRLEFLLRLFERMDKEDPVLPTTDCKETLDTEDPSKQVNQIKTLLGTHRIPLDIRNRRGKGYFLQRRQ